MEFDELSGKVIGCAIEVHKRLGPGLLESAYERCLSYELTAAGLRHETQKELPINYKGLKLVGLNDLFCKVIKVRNPMSRDEEHEGSPFFATKPDVHRDRWTRI